MGYQISPLFHLAWRYVTPAITGSLFILYMISQQSVKFNSTYRYPAWAIVLGWCLALTSILMLPLSMIVVWFKASSRLSFQEVSFVCISKHVLILLFCFQLIKQKLKILTTSKAPDHNKDENDKIEDNNNNNNNILVDNDGTFTQVSF